jgi:ribosomal protein L20A (L18A)
MLRENEDVFDVFCKNAYRIRYKTNGTFPEALTNFLFNDLTAYHTSHRLSIVIKEVVKKEVEISDTPDQLLKGFLDRLFKQIINYPECKRYLIYLFKSKYDRIDFNYINLKNIYDIYK